MKLVIDIDEDLYVHIKNSYIVCEETLTGKTFLGAVYNAIANGKLLPKGYGDLIDKNNLITITDISADGIEFTYVPYSDIEDAPTIIEADISGKENER